MDWVDGKSFFASCWKKYWWAAAIVLLGLILMALPEKKEVPKEQIPLPQENHENEDLQTSLEELLSHLDGVGKVKVLLSPASGAKTYYQANENLSKNADSSETRIETVIITEADRSQTAVVQRIDPPVYMGAVVICQGGDSPTVRLAVVDAVATATGLTSDKISVGKMK